MKKWAYLWVKFQQQQKGVKISENRIKRNDSSTIEHCTIFPTKTPLIFTSKWIVYFSFR